MTVQITEPRGCPIPGACSALAEIERLRAGIQAAYANIDGLTAYQGSGHFGHGFIVAREICLQVMRDVAGAKP